MTRNWMQVIISIIALLFYSSVVFAVPETFTLDPKHTYILWRIHHFGFSTQVGKWYASGNLILDKDNPQNSKVNATIQVSNIITGLPDLDKHLLGPLFFDVKQFPTATFVSNKVNLTGKDTAEVEGTLTLHNVSKPITLNVKLNSARISPITDKMTAGFSATTHLKRSDFGIKTLLPGLGDDVEIEIGAEAYQSN